MVSFESVVNVKPMLVLRSKVNVHALEYSLERGDREPDLSIWSFRDQQVSVNSPTCGTGMVLERHVPAQSVRPASCIDVHGSGTASSCSAELP